jgi:AraC family transcriptional regulator
LRPTFRKSEDKPEKNNNCSIEHKNKFANGKGLQEPSMIQPAPQLRSAATYRDSTFASYSLAVERVIQTMRAQLAEPLSLEEMAEIAYLSPFHFNRIFRSLTGIPPGEFLAALRLDAAKRLLLTTALSVTDVCFDLGYTSLGTFTTRFKHLIGLSPVQLRRLAEDEALASLKPLYERSREAQRLAIIHTRGVSGTITAPGPFTGLIFVGLFPRPIPQGRPTACVTLAAPGRYHISLVPDGQHYLFCAALPRSQSALAYLVPESGLLVGAAEQPVLVRGGWASAPADLILRPLHAADPPLLVIPPSLLAAPSAASLR